MQEDKKVPILEYTFSGQLIQLQVLSSSQWQVVYVIEGKVGNDRLWCRYPLLRDIIVTVGTFILMTNPAHAEKYIGCDVLIIVSSKSF